MSKLGRLKVNQEKTNYVEIQAESDHKKPSKTFVNATLNI